MSVHFISSPPLASMSDPSSARRVAYTFNSNIMVAAIVILFIVVFFVVSLHVYAKWFWRHGATTSLLTSARIVSWRRRQRRGLDFASNDSLVLANICVGLDLSTINSLPTFTYQAPQHGTEPLLECAVCLSEFQAHDKGRFLPNCKHSFHTDCIDMWFYSHSTCPLCRAPVSMLDHQHHEQTTLIQRDFPPPLLQNIAPFATHQDDELNTSVQTVSSPLPPQSAASAMTHHPQEQNTYIQRYSSPLPLLQSTAGLQSHQQHQEGLANSATTAPVSSALVPLAGALIPSNEGLLCKDDTHGGSHVSLPCVGAIGSSSTRLMSREIPRQPESTAIARCVSLSMPRYPSDDNHAGLSQPLKSPSFRMSIKWLLSRELSKGGSRVYPSEQVNAEILEQELEPSTSNSKVQV